MNRVSLLFLAFFYITCTGGKADAVLIVKDEGIQVQGKVTFERGPDGEFGPKIMVPGYIVVFKVDGNIGDVAGKAGLVYRINDNLKLVQIDQVDPQLSDEEIQKRFLK